MALREEHGGQLVLISLDGWGHRTSSVCNAIKAARTPNMDRFWRQYPHAILEAAGMAVGLPDGFIGNSQVGHIHMGAGQPVPQDMLRIENSIKDGSFFNNRALLSAMHHVKKNGSSLHLMGLASDAGVHSHLDHLFALLRLVKRRGIKDVFIHVILDGRDVPPKSALRYLRAIEAETRRIGVGRIASICGRYFAMDRDGRWEREARAYEMLTRGAGFTAKTALDGFKEALVRGETDEFVQPTVIIGKKDRTVHHVHDGDALIFFNFRSDRARQITHALVDREFTHFSRERVRNLHLVCFAQYAKEIRAQVAFPPVHIKGILGEVLAKHHVRQMRIAETEKYAHVTFFFNNAREKPFPLEDRILIPSPKVATYDLAPEMSAEGITKAALKTIRGGKHRFTLINFANADMVGHAGKFSAAVKGIEKVDSCVRHIADAVLRAKGHCIITADHGNAEDMTPPHLTSHTTSDVPFILVCACGHDHRLLARGTLQDVAPTALDLLSIAKPARMRPGLLR